MKQNLLNDLVAAMKSQDKETLSVLRMVKGAIQLEEINKKSELSDEDFIGVVSKQIKTRKESITEFEKAGRTDLVEQTKKEIEILNYFFFFVIKTIYLFEFLCYYKYIEVKI